MNRRIVHSLVLKGKPKKQAVEKSNSLLMFVAIHKQSTIGIA
jgi:hypothetical protein